jgi:hypothetical protein
VDFLICRNDDWMPMLGIELDDDSHEKAARKQRDMFVNELFASTGIPLLRIHLNADLMRAARDEVDVDP